MFSTPAFTAVAPEKVLAVVSVRVALLVLFNPPVPLSVPAKVPELTVKRVGPLRFSVPPFSAFTLEVVPLKFKTPPLTVPALNVAEDTTPPLMSLVKRPATFTVPKLIPPFVIVALEANRVFPAPDSEANVVVPEALVKETLFAAAFPLLTAPRLRFVPLIVAAPLASTFNAPL
jgi:hypothetical protein